MVGEHSGKVVFHLLLHNGTGLPDDYDGHDDYDDDDDDDEKYPEHAGESRLAQKKEEDKDGERGS